MARATTVRFTDEMFARLDQASARTGMPVNSIVVAACLEWMERHTPRPPVGLTELSRVASMVPAPRWATIRRAVEVAAGKVRPSTFYPFERFSKHAQKMLAAADSAANEHGHSYMGTEHLLLGAFADSDFHSARILARLGVAEERVAAAIDAILSRDHVVWRDNILPTQRVKRVIELAFKLCGAAGDPQVSTGHILLALRAEGKGIAAQVLQDQGATQEQIEIALAELTEPEP